MSGGREEDKEWEKGKDKRWEERKKNRKIKQNRNRINEWKDKKGKTEMKGKEMNIILNDWKRWAKKNFLNFLSQVKEITIP